MTAETARPRGAPFNILYQDEDIVAIDKPAGFFVHPPEDQGFRVPRTRICLSLLRAQLRQFVYPVHRLDAPTSGVLLWAFSREATSELSRAFREHRVQKVYQAVVRGFVDEQFVIDRPLETDTSAEPLPSLTEFRRLGQFEVPVAVTKKYPTSRYSWIEARPRTGRYHQIRRHLNRVSHPILGDTDHGDSHHNRFFRTQLGVPGLCLRAYELTFPHPRTGETLCLKAPVTPHWQKIESLFLN